MNVSIIQEKLSYKTFSISLGAKESNKYFDRATKNLSTSNPIKGFRPGQAPFDVVLKSLPRVSVYQEVALETLHDIIPPFLRDQALKRLGDPEVEFKQLEKGKDIIFKISVALWPHIDLPAYKDITVSNRRPEVSDEEIVQALDYLKKARKVRALDDAFAKSLGNFENLETLKASIREGIAMEKTNIAKEKARAQVLEKIREKTSIEIAPFLIEREAQKILDYEQKQLEQNGMQMEDYLKHLGKTQEEFIKQARDMAEKRLKNAFVLFELAKSEHIEVDDSEVEERLREILSRFSSPEEARKKIDPAALTQRLRQELLEEKVFANVLDKQIITT